MVDMLRCAGEDEWASSLMSHYLKELPSGALDASWRTAPDSVSPGLLVRRSARSRGTTCSKATPPERAGRCMRWMPLWTVLRPPRPGRWCRVPWALRMWLRRAWNGKVPRAIRSYEFLDQKPRMVGKSRPIRL